MAGQAKQDCPFCNREPGQIHARICSRSALRQADRAQTAKVVKHLHRTNFVWMAGMLLTPDELETLPEEIRTTARRARSRPKRRGQRAELIQAKVPGKKPIQLYWVPQQGTHFHFTA